MKAHHVKGDKGVVGFICDISEPRQTALVLFHWFTPIASMTLVLSGRVSV